MRIPNLSSSRRFFRLGIRVKLFLAIVTICAIMVVSMSAAVRYSFQNGFFEYLTEIEQDRVSGLAEELAEDYKQNGNWKSLRDSRNWRRKIQRFTRKSAIQQAENGRLASEMPPPPPPETTAKTPSRQDKKSSRKKAAPEAPPPSLSAAEQARHVWESAHLRSSLGLLDKDKTTLIAGVQPGQEAAWLPISTNGTVVGWLTREPLQGITDSIDLRFHEQQRTATFLIGIFGLLLAVAAAMIMAHYLIAPLRRFTDTTSRLAAGDFSARVESSTHQDIATLLVSLLKTLVAVPGRVSAFASTVKDAARSRIQSGKRMAVRKRVPPPPWQGDELQILAKQLNHLAGVLESNEKARRTFMAEVAHDLRTPISVLKGEIEALEDGVRQVTPESLASLRTEVDLISRLVDDIHTLSLADVGMLKYDRSYFDLVPCLASSLYTVKDRILERDLTLDADLPNTELTVHADPARLGQVFRNILENSMRYTDSGGNIQVRCRPDGAYVFIDILDSTPAVPEEQLPLLFERFHTGDLARTRGRSGSGLGLAICRTLLQAQDGDLRALPSPLGGLWIRMQLPLVEKSAGI